MNPRVFLRLLQLPRTIPFVAFWTAVALLFNRVYFGLAWPREALFVTAAVTLPLLLGITFASCLHAALHRPFALLLPSAGKKFRRAAALGYLVLAAALTFLDRALAPAAPMPALFGLALALLSLACGHRRQGFYRLGAFGGIAGLLLVASAWLVFHLRFASALQPALEASPAWFCLGGLAVASIAFSRGFSRAALRLRAATPYFAVAVTWAAFDRDVMRRQLEELSQFNVRRGRGARHLRRDWTLGRVSPRLRDWLRVLDHQQAMPPRRMLWIGFVVTVVALVTGVGAVSVLAFHGRAQPGGLFLGTLANLTAAPDQLTALARSSFAFLAVAVYAPMFGFNPSRPRLPYPISRTRLAEIVFAHLSVNLVGGLAVRLLAFGLCSFCAQVLVERFNPAGGLAAVVVLGLALLPFLPLSVLASFAAEGTPRNFPVNLRSIGVYLGAVIVLPVARLTASGFLLSPAGAVTCALLTAAGFLWLRQRIRRHYLNCDLNVEAAWASPLAR